MNLKAFEQNVNHIGTNSRGQHVYKIPEGYIHLPTYITINYIRTTGFVVMCYRHDGVRITTATSNVADIYATYKRLILKLKAKGVPLYADHYHPHAVKRETTFKLFPLPIGVYVDDRSGIYYVSYNSAITRNKTVYVGSCDIKSELKALVAKASVKRQKEIDNFNKRNLLDYDAILQLGVRRPRDVKQYTFSDVLHEYGYV